MPLPGSGARAQRSSSAGPPPAGATPLYNECDGLRVIGGALGIAPVAPRRVVALPRRRSNPAWRFFFSFRSGEAYIFDCLGLL